MSKDKDAASLVTGKPGIARTYGLLGDGFDQDEAGMALRAVRAAKYERDMKPYEDKKLEAARGELVKAFKASPGKWPDGIDSKYDRWYDPDDWSSEGVYIGARPCIKPLNPDPMINTPAQKVVKLDAARAALAGVEAKLGVKKVVIAPETVTKPTGLTVTKPPLPSVTKPSPVETPTMNMSKAIGGRPLKGDRPTTAAERMKAMRAKAARKKDGE